jgi:D-alanyl-D-alanine carboxypeptidase/D-alanyl-D-alanine-endopeptidase (penicillin-binding protein 4)
MKKTPAAGLIEAKTGTIEHVHTLTGYATTLGGERLAFAIFSNNGPSSPAHTSNDSSAIDAIAVAMVETLGALPPKSTSEKRR